MECFTVTDETYRYIPVANHQLWNKYGMRYFDSPSNFYFVGFDYGYSPNKKPMKVTSMVRRLLDKDAQTLVKAGFFNGDLELTSDGKEALFAIMLDSNKAALVAEAQMVIDEKDKK